MLYVLVGELVSNADSIFFETCRAVGSAFTREAHIDPSFGAAYKANQENWTTLTQGLVLATFCHWVEVDYQGKDSFKQRLTTTENQEALDLLFYLRNAFIHCQWDLTKMDYQNQANKIRAMVNANNGKYRHSIAEFEMWLQGNVVKLNGIEPMCRVLFDDV